MFAKIIEFVANAERQRCRNCGKKHKRKQMMYDQLWGWFCNDCCLADYWKVKQA